MDQTEYQIRMSKIRTGYEDLIRKAAQLGVDIPSLIDPIGISCDTGTGCCAGDGKMLDGRDLVVFPGKETVNR